MTMAPPAHRGPDTARAGTIGRTTDLAARLLGVALLATSAYTHLHLARLYDIGPPVTTGQLFIAQGVVTSVVALWLLVRGSTAAWIVATLVMAASAAAVLASVRLQIPAIGPFPTIYEPLWYPEKVVSAVAEGAFVVLALVRAGLVMRTKP